MTDLEELARNPVSRRGFMTRMTAAGLGAAAATFLASNLALGGTPAVADDDDSPEPFNKNGHTHHHNKGQTAAEFAGIPGRNVNELVLNFALTLEILEADLYRQALNQASGKPLADALLTDPTSYTQSVSRGHLPRADDNVGFEYLRQFAFVEAAHRDFLTAVLQSLGAPTAQRNPHGYAFPGGPGNTLPAILGNILPLEETGVRAYLGALPFLDDLTIAQTAGGIYSTEARHSAAVSYILGIDPGPSPRKGDERVIDKYPSKNTLEYFLAPHAVLAAASVYFVK